MKETGCYTLDTKIIKRVKEEAEEQQRSYSNVVNLVLSKHFNEEVEDDDEEEKA